MTHDTRLRPFLVADLFCGAGGSSTGAQRALAARGRSMELVAVNHWDRAIETHSLNHPTARHYCADLEKAHPADLVPELRLDLLMASPTCTYHSRARGGRPVYDQQRMDPWLVVRWLTDLRVKRLIIENVPEFVAWGPCDATGKPIKSRKGEYFRAWLSALNAVGFKVDHRILNCADYGDATTRKRFFLMGRSDGVAWDWPAPSHARAGTEVSLGLKPWRSARDIIDWSLTGRSIQNRKKPLAPRTIARILAGAIKFKWPEPYLVILRNHMDAQSVQEPLPTITATGTHIGLAEPILVNMKGKSTARDIDVPTPTQTAHARHLAVAEPFILSPQSSGAPREVGQPLPTITTGGASATKHPGCARHAVVEGFLLSQASGGAPRTIDDPVPTITTGGNGGAHALVAPYYGSGSGTTCNSDAQPLPTVTTKARFGIVVPVTNSGGGPNARDVAQPLPTMTTTKGGEFAVVMPVTHHGGDRTRSTDEPLPTVTGAHRGELGFVTASFGERQGQAPRVHSLDDPVPTICAQGHVNLVQARSEYDILFRMLEPKELAAATGFSDQEAAYEFAGNKTEMTKQIGNAVPVNTAMALVAALTEA